ncbi:hypothetical protein ACP4OV_029091 [Aristida adscensionis]
MARLPSAIVWAALLAVLGVGVSPGHGDLLGFPSVSSFPYALPLNPDTNCLASISNFPWNLLPGLYAQKFANLPPFRIVSQANDTVSVAVDESDNVVLAKTNCADPSQLWFQLYTEIVAADGYGGQCNRAFVLVNLGNLFRKRDRLLALAFVEGAPNYKATMAPYDPACLSVSMLWTKDDSRAGYFSKIRALINGNFVLDALYGNVREGTSVGVFRATHDDPNIFWAIKNFYLP